MKWTLILVLVIPLNLQPKPTNPDDYCLAKAIYHEARGEPLRGQLAVGWVVLNRAKTKSVCEVIYEKHQFSNIKQTKHVPDKFLQIAKQAKETKPDNWPATYFHNLQVKPKWNKKFLTKIGNHAFYH